MELWQLSPRLAGYGLHLDVADVKARLELLVLGAETGYLLYFTTVIDGPHASARLLSLAQEIVL